MSFEDDHVAKYNQFNMEISGCVTADSLRAV